MSNQESSFNLYEFVGGDETFQRLVDVFYARVEADADLRAIFPGDLEEGKRYQFLFLTQYWGGPTRYVEERGHPRLRMRHMPYRITPALRDAWVKYMLEAIYEAGIREPALGMMREYFERGATFMVNHITEGDDS